MLTLNPHAPGASPTAPVDIGLKPVVLKEADQALDEFAKAMKDDFSPLASSMHDAAKKLYSQVSRHWTEDKRHLAMHEWDSSDLIKDLLVLQNKQEPLWEKLLTDAHELQTRVDRAFEKVQKADKAVVAACAYKGPRSSWGGFATPEMEVIRRYHAKKLSHNMHDLKIKYDDICGYPDGSLTRIKALHRRALEETQMLIDKTAKKEKGRHHSA